MKTTHTYAILEISAGAYAEIRALLDAAGYQHAFHDDVVDMHGIAVRAAVSLSRQQLVVAPLEKLTALRQALDDLPLVQVADSILAAHAVQAVINAARDIAGGTSDPMPGQVPQ